MSVRYLLTRFLIINKMVDIMSDMIFYYTVDCADGVLRGTPVAVAVRYLRPAPAQLRAEVVDPALM